MLAVQRLNTDATWWLQIGDTTLLFDPWLVGPQINGFRWFNEEWHSEAVTPLEEVPDHQLIVITQPFSDHLHFETLRALPERPIAAVPTAIASLRKAFPHREIREIPTWGDQALKWFGVELGQLSGPAWRPPQYFGVVIRGGGHTVVNTPHGLAEHLNEQISGDVSLLATPRMHFRLPWFLGGTITPGPEAADAQVRQLNPKWVMAVHEEPKTGSGWVNRLSKVSRPPLSQAEAPDRWQTLPVSERVELSST